MSITFLIDKSFFCAHDTRMMTGTDFKRALLDLNMRQHQFAEMVGRTPEHVSRWACDRKPIPTSIEVLINTLVQQHRQREAAQ